VASRRPESLHSCRHETVVFHEKRLGVAVERRRPRPRPAPFIQSPQYRLEIHGAVFEVADQHRSFPSTVAAKYQHRPHEHKMLATWTGGAPSARGAEEVSWKDREHGLTVPRYQHRRGCVTVRRCQTRCPPCYSASGACHHRLRPDGLWQDHRFLGAGKGECRLHRRPFQFLLRYV
jgi:hypothetical protein